MIPVLCVVMSSVCQHRSGSTYQFLQPPSHLIIGEPSSPPLQTQNTTSLFLRALAFPFDAEVPFDCGFLLVGDLVVNGLESSDGKDVRPTPPDLDLVVRLLAAASAAVLLRELTIAYRKNTLSVTIVYMGRSLKLQTVLCLVAVLSQQLRVVYSSGFPQFSTLIT